MAATYEIATAYVSLIPSFRGAGRHIQTGLASNENRRAAGAAGSTLGTAAAAGAGRAIGSRAGSSAIAQGLSGAARASSGAAAAAGATIGQTVASGAGQALGGAAGSRSIGRGFGGAVRGAAGAIGSAAASAGSTFASGMGSAIGRGASTVGRGFRAVGNHLSAQAAAGGALAGAGFSNGFLRAMAPLAAIAGIGSFISAGFNRAANIEDAQKKLEALGYTGREVQETMDAALGSVQGTAFGLDEAATAAVGLLASGIEGDALERTLKTIADTATIAGVDMSEMGSIFNQVAANGTLQAEELNRLTDRGVPALQLLSDHLGVTVSDVRELMRQGEVSFADFATAMEEGFGGAAAGSGDTMRGTLRNVGAAISRFGASIWENLFPALKDGSNALIEFFDTVASPAAQRFMDFMNEHPGLARGVVVALGAITAALVGYAAALTAASVAQRLFTRTNVILLAISVIAGLVAALVDAYQTNEQFRSSVQSVFSAVGGFISAMWQRVSPIFNAIRDWFTSTSETVDGTVTPVWQRLTAAFDTVREAVSGAVAVVRGRLSGAFESFRGIVSAVANAVSTGFGAAMEWLTGTLFPGVASALQTVGRFFSAVWGGALIALRPFIATLQTMWNVVSTVVRGILSVVAPVARWFYDVFKNVFILAIDLFVFAVQWLWNNAIRTILPRIQRAWAVLAAAFMAVWRGIIKPAIDLFAAGIRWLWNNVLSRIFPLIRKGWDALGRLVQAVYRSLIKPTIDAFARVAQWLWRNVLQPTFRFIQDRWRQLSIAFRAAWHGVIRPAIDAFGRAVRFLHERFIRPAVDRIRSVWRGLSEIFRNVWRNNIKPVLDAFGRFVRHTLPDMIRRGVDALGRAWRSIANKFRSPINWVINTVWNNGLKRGFDGIARAVNSDARLPSIPNIPAFAEGGRHSGGWALVGEEGPELVNFSNPGRVYTAAETQEMLSRGQDLPPDLARRAAGSDPSEAVAPMGGNLFSNIGRAVGGWLRQGMAKVAENLARPLKGLIRNTVGRWGDIGRLGGDTAIHVIDKAVSWVRGQDNPMAGGATHGGPPPGSGAWRRPSFGPITSRYGPRWGGFHAGIDIAGGGPTFAAADGTVYRVGTGILGGRTGIGIGISHGGGVFTYYGHNPVGGPRVRPGQKVKAGQHIGYQGATGNVTGTHLHFELHRGGWGRAVNPASLPVFDQGGAVKPGVSLIENRTGKMEYLANVTDAVNNGGASGAKVEQHFHGNHYDERQLARFAANRTRDVLRSTRF